MSKKMSLVIATLLFAIIVALFTINYDRINTKQQIEKSESVKKSEQTDVVFNDARDVLEFQSDYNKNKLLMDEFSNMENYSIEAVIKIMNKKDMPITIKNIVDVYKKNKDIYDELGIDVINDNMVLDTIPDEINYREEIDTLNGKPIKVTIKEEKFYEKQ